MLCRRKVKMDMEEAAQRWGDSKKYPEGLTLYVCDKCNWLHFTSHPL